MRDRGSFLRSLDQRYLDHLPALLVLERFADLLYNVAGGARCASMSNTGDGSVMDETGAIFADLQNISVNRGHFYDEALHPFT